MAAATPLTISQFYASAYYHKKNNKAGREQLCEYLKLEHNQKVISSKALEILEFINKFEDEWSKKKEGEGYNIFIRQFQPLDTSKRIITPDKKIALRGALFYKIVQIFSMPAERTSQNKLMNTWSFFLYKALDGSNLSTGADFIFKFEGFNFEGSKIQKLLKKLAVDPKDSKGQKPFDVRDKEVIKRDKEFNFYSEMTDSNKGFEYLQEMQDDPAKKAIISEFLEKIKIMDKLEKGTHYLFSSNTNDLEILKAFHDVSTKLTSDVEKQKAIKSFLLSKVKYINNSFHDREIFELKKLTKFIEKFQQGKIKISRADKENIKDLRNKYKVLIQLGNTLDMNIKYRDTCKNEILETVTKLKESNFLKLERFLDIGATWGLQDWEHKNELIKKRNTIREAILLTLQDINKAILNEDLGTLKQASDKLESFKKNLKNNGFEVEAIREFEKILPNYQSLFSIIDAVITWHKNINEKIEDFNKELEEFHKERDKIKRQIETIDQIKKKWFEEFKTYNKLIVFTAKVETQVLPTQPTLPVAETVAAVGLETLSVESTVDKNTISETSSSEEAPILNSSLLVTTFNKPTETAAAVPVGLTASATSDKTTELTPAVPVGLNSLSTSDKPTELVSSVSVASTSTLTSTLSVSTSAASLDAKPFSLPSTPTAAAANSTITPPKMKPTNEDNLNKKVVGERTKENKSQRTLWQHFCDLWKNFCKKFFGVFKRSKN